MSRFIQAGGVAVTTALLAVGCAQERTPRSFVQPNAIKKSDLVGTWHYIQTVADAPPTSSFMFIGNSSELMKVKFDVQENTLFARRAYEQIQGSEDSFTQNPSEYQGQPLAAWRIDSQFDIIRDYNPTTGEETNKIIESTERPWDQREYIRVDWSQNIITDVVGLGLNFFFQEGASVEPTSYWESDPTKPDALHLERADATDPGFLPGEANYLDITNKMVVTPNEQSYCYTENGTQSCFVLPQCFLAYEVDDCASQVVKVRHAFAKISDSHDYQPRLWDGLQMNDFGIWDVGLARLTYNRQYGITNSGMIRHAARFNLWEKSHGSQTCQTDADCGNTTQDATGAKCDIGIKGSPLNGGICTIPYKQRTLRTIPYYAESSLNEYQADTNDSNTKLTPFPDELFPVGQEIISQWNSAVKAAVADVTGAAPQTDVFVWCHNPVQLRATTDSLGNAVPADAAACQGNLKAQLDASGNVLKDKNGDPIYKARTGDPRRSTIFWVNQEQNAGPLGYGPPLFDPETGETISGQAYIYGAALDTYAARSRDLVLLLLGKIAPTDYINGLNVQSWVDASRAGVLNKGQTTSPDELKQRFAAMDFSWARGLAAATPIDTSSVQALVQSMKAREDNMYSSGVFGLNNADLAQVRRDKLKDTPLEAMMVTPDVMDMGGAQPGTDWTTLSEAEKWRVSPVRSGVVRKAISDRMDQMRTLGVDFAEFADEGVVQRALKLANDPSIVALAPEVIRSQLRKDIFLAVTLHEVGHNMGLRHNFRASFDAMNYFPGYWSLRQAAASNPSAQKYVGLDVSQSPPAPITTATYGGADCNDTTNPLHKGHIRPRYVDCPGGATSVAEVQGGIREFQYTSIMDYGAEFNSDINGLGHYDKAAMKFSYAGDGFVEVFTNSKTDSVTQGKWESIHTFQTAFGFPSPLTTGVGLSSINYPTYPDLFTNGYTDLEARADVPFSSITLQGPTGAMRADPQGRPMVPYFFCSDEFAGNLTCQRFDSGADAFEQAQDLISRYSNFYILNNFKRDRYTFHSSLAYTSRIQSRYMDMIRQQMTWYVLLRSDFEDYVFQLAGSGPPYNDPNAYVNNFFTDENGWGSFTLAVTQGFDMMGKIISQPSAGQYVAVDPKLTTDSTYGYFQKFSDNLTEVGGAKTIGLIDGKYIDTTWDFSGCGYYWADECETRVGYFRDKVAAMDELSQSQAYFTGRDTSTDVRKYAIGYILPFKNQIQEKIGALLSGDTRSLAPSFDSSGNVVNNGWTLNDNGASKNVANLIDPAGGFTLQLYAGVYGLSSFPTTFDQSFIDTTQVFVVGNGEAPVADSLIMSPDGPGSLSTTNPSKLIANGGTYAWFVWTDTENGKQYAAHSIAPVTNGNFGSGTPYRNDTGARMLEQAASVQAAQQTACAGGPTLVASCEAKTRALANFRQNIQVMRSLHNAYGYGVYKTDAPFYY